jgi:hypothetical protein
MTKKDGADLLGASNILYTLGYYQHGKSILSILGLSNLKQGIRGKRVKIEPVSIKDRRMRM